MTLDRPEAVRIEVNGEDFEMPEASGEVVSQVEIAVDGYVPSEQDVE